MEANDNWDTQIALSMLGLEFVFLTMMMDIPRDDVLFNQTKSFYLPLYFAIPLPDFIQSCILISFSLLIMLVIFQITPIRRINLRRRIRLNDRYQEGYTRSLLYIGAFYWILLFISSLTLYNIKFDSISTNIELTGIYILFVIFGNIGIQFYMFRTLLPQSFENEIRWGYTVNDVVTMAHLIFWGLFWVPMNQTIYPQFRYFTLFGIQFATAWSMILLMILIEYLTNPDFRRINENYVI